MISFKPEMDIATARHYLQRILNDSVSTVKPINFGEVSKVFSYTYQDQEYVIHFNSNGERFIKDQSLFKKLTPHGIPIPQIVTCGEIEKLHFSISHRAPGQVMEALSNEEIKSVLPQLAFEYKKVCQFPVDQSKNFGFIQANGDGSHPSWQQFIASFFQEEQVGFWKDWYALFDDSFLEKDVFNHYYNLMMELTSYAPKEKYLVHGDFHLGNMLTDGERITAIVDWEMALYGDFMFDIANQHYWAPQLDIPNYIREEWRKDGKDIPHFAERLLCGMLFKGIDGLRFYTKKEDKDAYNWMKTKLSTCVEEYKQAQ